MVTQTPLIRARIIFSKTVQIIASICVKIYLPFNDLNFMSSVGANRCKYV